MAVIFFDLDGTLVDFGTHKPLEGAVETVNRLYDEGHTIIFTTRRGDKEFPGHMYYSRTSTYAFLRLEGFKYHDIMFDLQSPRVVVNDEGAIGIQVERNAPVSYDDIAEKINHL